MATLKSTLKIESTDIFPTPVNFTQINNNAVNGTFSGFNTLDVPANSLQTLNFLGSIDATGAYVYISAATTNAHPVYVGAGAVAVSSATIKLYPGDVAFFPAGDSNGAYDLGAICAAGETGTISFFIGEKA
jgi:hypothetical protein